MTRTGILFVVLALAGAGCSFITPFDDESQPCDPGASPEDECLPTYYCVREGQPDGGICKKRPDAGT